MEDSTDLPSSERSNDLARLSDEELVRRILKTGDVVLREELYNRYAPFVYKRSLAIMGDADQAKDMTHDVMLKLFLSLGSFAFRSSFSYWVHRITYNHCLNVLKKQKKWKLEDMESLPEGGTVPGEGVPEEKEDMEKQLTILEEAMRRLSEAERMLLWMHYRDGLSLKEMAGLLGIGLSAVKMRLKRVRDKLALIYAQTEVIWDAGTSQTTSQ